ncbi:MAG TPA: hypothetical protein VN493_15070 [Thermoanaerobaculia bacterium]|nr:hypothetical protein [Thermoanaerobaculia bacterium]
MDLVARLRRLRTACVVLAGFVLAYGVAGWFLIEGFQLRPFGKVPEALPLSITFLAAVLILLASRLRTGILRGGLPSNRMIPADLGNLMSAYQRATLVSFAVLELAALMGLLVALLSGSSFYGVVLCVASFLSMLMRWPKAYELDRLARGRVSP